MTHVAVRFTQASRVQAMLDVEVALAEALADAGVIPASSVPPIRAAARAELYDLDALVEDAVGAGNILIPLVQQLTRRVAAMDNAAAGHVHWGATSQDVMDTALVLQLRAAVGDIVCRWLEQPMLLRIWRDSMWARRWLGGRGCSRPRPRRSGRRPLPGSTQSPARGCA